jgi:serine/threonine protein kinase
VTETSQGVGGGVVERRPRTENQPVRRSCDNYRTSSLSPRLSSEPDSRSDPSHAGRFRLCLECPAAAEPEGESGAPGLQLQNMNRPVALSPPTPTSRYTITREIASGGMATVYLGRLAGPGGFSRSVAIKRPHAHVARHPEFRAMLLDEGRLAASISHPNVVSTLDVVAEGDDLFLVMEYIPGETLAQIQRVVRRRGEAIPPAIACAILRGVLHGLWAVHSARDELGAPLGIVHRDISPQNILVGKDGVARILDFGVAKAAGRLQVTREGQLKGKIAYMAPEQMQGNVTSRTDVYAASIVLWEALTARRLFSGDDDVEIFSKALTARVEPPSKYARTSSPRALDERDTVGWVKLDAAVLRGLARNPAERFASAQEMASALEECVEPATVAEVSAWLEGTTAGGEEREQVASTERSSIVTVDERGIGAPLATLTKSGQDALAVQVRAGAEPVSNLAQADAAPSSGDSRLPSDIRAPRPRRAALLALGSAALALGGFFLVTHSESSSSPVSAEMPSGYSTNAAPLVAATPAPSASATAQDTAVREPASAPGAAPSARLGSGAGFAGGDEASSPRVRAKTVLKNRVERSARVPVVSPSIDVSHAIDQRH